MKAKIYLSEVKAGVAFLDKRYGKRDWLKKINVRKLDLSDPNACILGQTDSNYYDHAVKLGLDPYSEELEKLGFDLPVLPCDQVFLVLRSLTHTWRSVIRQLKKKRGLRH